MLEHNLAATRLAMIVLIGRRYYHLAEILLISLPAHAFPLDVHAVQSSNYALLELMLRSSCAYPAQRCMVDVPCR